MYEFMLITIMTGILSKYTTHISWSTTRSVNEHTSCKRTRTHTNINTYTHGHTQGNTHTPKPKTHTHTHSVDTNMEWRPHYVTPVTDGVSE